MWWKKKSILSVFTTCHACFTTRFRLLGGQIWTQLEQNKPVSKTLDNILVDPKTGSWSDFEPSKCEVADKPIRNCWTHMSRGRFKAHAMKGYVSLRKRRGFSSLARVFDFKPKLISGTNWFLVQISCFKGSKYTTCRARSAVVSFTQKIFFPTIWKGLNPNPSSLKSKPEILNQYREGNFKIIEVVATPGWEGES